MTSIAPLANEDHKEVEWPLNKFVSKLLEMKELAIAIPVTEDFEANFLLYQSPNTSKCRFYVSVVDEQKNAHFFFLDKCKENCWKIQSARPLPDWIRNLEAELNELIAYEMDLENWEAK
jgi:hypothetical protein